jgi:hypothetical protein
MQAFSVAKAIALSALHPWGLFVRFLFFVLPNRQKDPESGSLADFTGHVNVAMVFLHDTERK